MSRSTSVTFGIGGLDVEPLARRLHRSPGRVGAASGLGLHAAEGDAAARSVARRAMKTVLLVHPEASMRAGLTAAIGDRGYRVVAAASLAELSPSSDLDVGAVVLEAKSVESPPPGWVSSLLAAGGGRKLLVLADTSGKAPALETAASDIEVRTLRAPWTPARVGEEVAQLLEPTAHRYTSKRESLPRVLVALRDSYVRSLPQKLERLREATLRALGEGRASPAWGEAKLQAHQLRGTAASYGFTEVSAAAGKLEDAIEAEERHPESAAESGSAVREAVAELAEHVGGSRRSTAPAVSALVRIEPGVETEDSGVEGEHSPLVHVPEARVLVVVADPAMEALADVLAREQVLDVRCLSNPAAALALARREPPDIALIDIPAAHPETAFRLARSLRALPRLARLPLAFVAAEPGMEFHVAATHAGASLVLAKPPKIETFTAAVRQLLAQRHDERARVLILDDDRAFNVRLAVVLSASGMDVHVIEDPALILDALDETHPDALLLDLGLPGLSGVEVCRMLRILPRWQELPILFITAHAGLESRMAAFAAGADDYLVKPLVDEELRSRIEVRVERARLRKERQERDALTGLLLRRAFLQDLAARLREAERHHRPLALCMLDLDHFKAINDARGHLAGDRVLSGLGTLLERRFRNEDLRGRWGGEEFVLGFPGEHAGTIESVVARLLEEFQRLTFYDDRGDVLRASFSAGVASFPDDGRTIEELLHVADRRLYAAKAAGRRRVCSRD